MLVRVVECTSEVFSAVSAGFPPEEFARACANLANYSMIVAHLALTRGLEDTKAMQAPSARLP